MHARRFGLLGLWILTLAFLAWAAAPDRSAPAWDATTFESRLTGRGAVRLQAREGGYAPAFAPESHGYRPRSPRVEEPGAGAEHEPLQGAATTGASRR